MDLRRLCNSSQPLCARLPRCTRASRQQARRSARRPAKTPQQSAIFYGLGSSAFACTRSAGPCSWVSTKTLVSSPLMSWDERHFFRRMTHCGCRVRKNSGTCQGPSTRPPRRSIATAIVQGTLIAQVRNHASIIIVDGSRPAPRQPLAVIAGSVLGHL